MNKYGKVVLLVAISVAIFYVVFDAPGTFLSNQFRGLLESGAAILFPDPPDDGAFIHFLLRVFVNGVVPVVIILLGFLPQIFLIFLSLELIKFLDLKLQTHYLLAFGCTTMAVGSTENLRKRDMVLISFIPCGAKLPIILTFGAVLGLNFIAVFFIYVLCIGVGFLLSRTQKCDGCKAPCVIEKPSPKSAISNSLAFIARITGPVMIAAPILYFLHELGYLYSIADFISPVFAPLGFAHPVLIVAILFGFLGKELVLATLVTLAAALPPLGDTAALSFLIFVILGPPCISALAAIRTQSDAKFTATVFFLTFTAAYIASFVFFWASMLF